MPMDDDAIAGFAAAVAGARASRRTLDADATRAEWGGPQNLVEAYRVQAALAARRAAAGERRVGWKLGYTSLAMRAQMGIEAPNYGPLTDAMMLRSPAVLPERCAQPRVEPEIALILGTDLAGPVDVDDVLAATRAAHACLEVVDSVWRDYHFQLEDNTADLSSAAFVVLGPEITTDDLPGVTVTLRVGGVDAGSATGSAASGHPAAGVCWLAGQLAAQGERLRAGDVVITGGLLPAVVLEPGGLVSATFADAADVSVRRSA